MSMLVKAATRFFTDEKAAEVTELGIILALIVAGAVVAIAAFGPKIVAAYESVQAALGA